MSERYPHLPRVGRYTPLSTYRLQITPDFTFNDAADIIPYLVNLGITDIYLSPILQAVPGSQHGYDVIDHHQISSERGGREGYENLVKKAHEAGLHIVVDIVPNHMAVPTPVYYNRALWSVLKKGLESHWARWFDIDENEKIMMPILGSRIGQVIKNGEFEIVSMIIPTEPEYGEQWVLKYYDNIFPLAEGTESLPLTVLLERQYYRLAYWKVGDEELNYRRFFDVDTLAGLRMERLDVFEDTHSLLFDLFDNKLIDGFRVDHPDGLADPRGYFQRLSDRTGGAWIAAEKILEDDEQLPYDWDVSGTTGYDTSWRLHSLQIDPRGVDKLGVLMQELTGDSPADYSTVIKASKRQIIDTSLAAEINRIASLMWKICQEDLRLRDYTIRTLVQCLRALVVNLDCYRVYYIPGSPASAASREHLDKARRQALEELIHSGHTDVDDTMDLLFALLMGDEVGSASLSSTDERRSEVAVRFQQLCGAVMAKGVEDTGFYRWTHLLSLTEVGSSPTRFALSPDDFHSFENAIESSWPATLTCGTTHDSKHGEDVRATLAALSQHASSWIALVKNLRATTEESRPHNLDGRSENTLWQTLAGTRSTNDPMTPDRLRTYLTKAVREQKDWTTWTNPDVNRENEFLDFAESCLTNQEVQDLFTQWDDLIAESRRNTVLVSKIVQLMLPGVADIYQGSEITRSSLVDPDNRRQIDFAELIELDKQICAGRVDSLNAEKYRLTKAALHLRQRQRWAFVSQESTYEALPVSTGHTLAFTRGDQHGPQVICIATLRTKSSSESSNWTSHTVVLPEGKWVNILNKHKHYEGGAVALSDLISDTPVILLERLKEGA